MDFVRCGVPSASDIFLFLGVFCFVLLSCCSYIFLNAFYLFIYSIFFFFLWGRGYLYFVMLSGLNFIFVPGEQIMKKRIKNTNLHDVIHKLLTKKRK